ncbi:MAG: hypothetical protein D3916_07815 [Candidatus Electrothrix sp. MAN1_4]|nr:hypothetical protein [Candidatus Electrothrix sp. MAN1_4]
MGFPVTDQKTTPDTFGCYNHFQGGSIYWTDETGAHAVHKNIRDQWKKERWETGYLGYPITSTKIYSNKTKMVNRFQGGEITWEDGIGAVDTVPFNKLRLRLHKVKCIDETGREFFEPLKEDKIELGVVPFSANGGTQPEKKSFSVGTFKQDGDEVNYDHPKELVAFDLKNDTGWSKNFTVAIFLSEKNPLGGFGDFLKELAEEVRDKLVTLLAEKTEEVIGEGAESLWGALGKIIGSIIGKILGWIIKKLFGWLIKLLLIDNIFPEEITVDYELPSIWETWEGRTYSPTYTSSTGPTYGEYEVSYFWELIA